MALPRVSSMLCKRKKADCLNPPSTGVDTNFLDSQVCEDKEGYQVTRLPTYQLANFMDIFHNELS